LLCFDANLTARPCDPSDAANLKAIVSPHLVDALRHRSGVFDKQNLHDHSPDNRLLADAYIIQRK
jgi:hypothetical protein